MEADSFTKDTGEQKVTTQVDAAATSAADLCGESGHKQFHGLGTTAEKAVQMRALGNAFPLHRVMR
ncbi:hypothetical protein [Nocardia suismassiliense]|uniref:hypothetical protein n=1 Tax=Nocardia suismassiliense TaxID=2077092 RepID=UPI001F484FB5|nr:hypothetical protein [Nocardia suismassiliense]